MNRKDLEDMKAAMAAPTFDGVARPAEVEERINQTVRAALSGPSGEAFMDYLRSITVNFVVPPTASDAVLRHHEGKRHLFQILDARRRSAKGD